MALGGLGSFRCRHTHPYPSPPPEGSQWLDGHLRADAWLWLVPVGGLPPLHLLRGHAKASPPCCYFNCQAVVDWYLGSWALGLGTSRDVRELNARCQMLGTSFWGTSRTFHLSDSEVQHQDQNYQVQGSTRQCWMCMAPDALVFFQHPWNLQLSDMPRVHSAHVMCRFLGSASLGWCLLSSQAAPVLTAAAL